MKKSTIQKLITASVAGMFIVNGVPITKVNAKYNDKKVKEIPMISPTPENIIINGENIAITNSINLQGVDVADDDAVRILREFFADNNISINEQYDELSTTFIIGEANDNLQEMNDAIERLNIEGAKNLKDEGYILAIDKDLSGKGTILIEGKDEDGTFYGVKTLEQLLEKRNDNNEFSQVYISDQPTMKTRGIVEGFYGTPWTNDDRIDQLKFYGDYKMNTYIYAPKDDPYHRDKWREPYPQSEMERMKGLIETAKQNKVDFVFGISPGIDIKFDGDDGEKDFQTLINKCESLYQMGVRSFAIYFDDIHDKSGVKQANVLNRFNNEFIKKKDDVKTLITVPTEYDTFAMGGLGDLSKYTKDFSETLDKDIMVMWTGNVVVSEEITLENAQNVNEIYGKRMGIWWNYPVTDYKKDKLALGPIYGVDKRLEGEIDFFTMNPMEHANLSKITLATGADYSWNTSSYDYEQSFDNVIKLLFEDLYDEMKTFANHSTRMEAAAATTGRYDAPKVRETMDTLLIKLGKKQDVSSEVEYLYNEFENMINSATKLKAELPKEILAECSSNLDKLKLVGEVDKLALDMLLENIKGNTDEANKIKEIINSNLQKINSGFKISEKTGVAFIDECLNYNPYPVASFEASTTFAAPGEKIEFSNTSSKSVENFEWTFEGANIENSTQENPIVSYDKEGIYSVELKTKNAWGESISVKKELITISEAATNERNNLSVGKTATASSYVASSEAPKFAIDGNSRTKWCAVGNTRHWITIDLGSINAISDIEIEHAESGGESSGMNTAAYTIEVSKDGENFKEVVNVKNNKSAITKDSIPVENARYVRVNIDKPTQGPDTATRIFEIKVMGIEGEIELPPVYESPIIVSKPLNLMITNKGKNTVSLKWDAPEKKKGLIGYKIYIDGKLINEIEKNINEYTIENLKNNSIYNFKVVSKYSNGEKSKPISISVRTEK
ncbi:MAG: beta-N-acetylglucosaminidase domain-containing protein [Sarcina sp.]